MQQHDVRDLVGGALLTALGLFVALYAYNHYPLGSMARIGPAAYPMGLGVLLSALGLAIALPAWKRRADSPLVQLRSAGLVLMSILAFAFTLRPLGLVAATFTTVVISSLADRETTWQFRLVLAAAISLLTVLIFRVALGMPLRVWPW